MFVVSGSWTAPADPADIAAFERDYAERHVPIAARLPGLRRLTTIVVTDGHMGGEVRDYRLVEAVFDDRAAYDAARETPEFAAMRVDRERLMARYGIENTAQLGEGTDAVLRPSGPALRRP